MEIDLTSSRPTVLVYRNVLLPTSETFIKEQVKATRRWRAVLVGRRPVHQLALDDVDVRLLMPHNGNIFGRISWKIGEWTATSQQSAAGRLKVEGASLIHAHFGMDAIDAWPIAQALGLPMLVTLHGFDIGIHREFWEAGRGGRTLRNYPRNLLRLARNPRVHFIAVSDALRQCAIAFGIPQEKIRVSYTGIDTTRFVPAGAPVAAREPRALFVGRLVEKKGCEYLIKAFAHVQARAPGASLVIIGDGPLRSELQELASKEGVRAEFRGAQSHENVLLELQKVRALCLPSIRAKNGDVEGFGMVLLEAQASGVPVVSSAMGGATEGIDDGVTGFRFAERDVDALSARLISLLTDDKIANSLSLAGPPYVSGKFDIRRCTGKLESLYDRAVSQG